MNAADLRKKLVLWFGDYETECVVCGGKHGDRKFNKGKKGVTVRSECQECGTKEILRVELPFKNIEVDEEIMVEEDPDDPDGNIIEEEIYLEDDAGNILDELE